MMGGSALGSDWQASWRNARRICSPDHFATYFRFALPAGALSKSELRKILASTTSQTDFSAVLANYRDQRRPAGGSMVRTVLERLEDYAERVIPEAAIPAIISALLDIGDELADADEVRGMFEFGTDVYIGRLCWQLLQRLDRQQRAGVLRSAMATGRGLATICREIAILGQQQGRRFKDQEPEDVWLVSTEQLDELERLGAARIREAATSGQLSQCHGLPSILYDWKCWEEAAAARDWGSSLLDDQPTLLKLIEQFLTESKSQSSGERIVRTTSRVNYEALEEFFDLDRLGVAVNTFPEDISDRQRVFTTLFLKEYERRRRDPSAAKRNWFDEED